MPKQRQRPVFLDLLAIKMPPNAVASILHRLSGVLIILSLPILIYFLDLSLRNQQSFEALLVITSNPFMQVYIYLLLWAIAHHFFAGIRYFLIDLEVIQGQCATRGASSIVVALGVLVPLVMLMVQIL